MRMIKGMMILASSLLLGACGGDDVCYGGPGSTVCGVNTLTLQLSETSVSISAPTTVIATVKATDNNGQPVSGAPVSFAADNGATCVPSATQTDGSGVATANVSIRAAPTIATINVVAVSGSLKATASFDLIP